MSKRKTIRTVALWGSLASVAASVIVGCHSTDARHNPHADVPKGSMPSEPGTYVREFVYRQCAKAEADDFVLYRYEFTEDTANLGPFGRKHLAAIYKRLEADAPFGIMIEATSDPKVDEARYLAVTDILGQLGVPDPATRVRIGIPGAEGMYGDQAEQAYGRLLSGSAGLPGFGGFGSGPGGGGFGGGTGGAGFGGGGFGAGGFGSVPLYR